MGVSGSCRPGGRRAAPVRCRHARLRALALPAVLGALVAVVLGGPVVLAAPLAASEADAEVGFVVPEAFFAHEQWGLFNFGQPVGGSVRGTVDADIRAPEAWSVTTGSREVRVAVIDTGVALDHPDLAPNLDLDAARDLVDPGTAPHDLGAYALEGGLPMGHGTAVASIIGAVGGAEAGMTGVSPQVTILPIRALDVTGVQDRRVAEAIDHAARHGAHVVNLSFASFVPGFGMSATVEAIARHPDVLFVAAAGNEGADADLTQPEPCTLEADNLLCVAASDQEDALARFVRAGSNRGAATVHLAAPGANILVAQPAQQVVFAEGFEDGLDGWEIVGSDGIWAHDPAVGFDGSDGTGSLVARGGAHEPGSRASVRLTDPVEIAGLDGCRLDLRVRADERVGGLLVLETSTDGERWHTRNRAFSMAGSTDGWEVHGVPLVLEAGGPVWVGFELWVPRSVTATADVWLDGLEIVCLSAEYTGRELGYAEGTSFAAPHVSGVAALVWAAHPQLTASEVRRAILDGVQSAPALEGLTVTGGRLDALGALQRAASLADGTHASGQPAGHGVASGPGGAAPGAAQGGLLEHLVLPETRLAVPASRGGAVPSAPQAEDAGEAAGAAEPAEGAAGPDATAATPAGDGAGLVWLLTVLAALLLGLVGAGVVWRRRSAGDVQVAGLELPPVAGAPGAWPPAAGRRAGAGRWVEIGDAAPAYAAAAAEALADLAAGEGIGPDDVRRLQDDAEELRGGLGDVVKAYGQVSRTDWYQHRGYNLAERAVALFSPEKARAMYVERLRNEQWIPMEQVMHWQDDLVGMLGDGPVPTSAPGSGPNHGPRGPRMHDLVAPAQEMFWQEELHRHMADDVQRSDGDVPGPAFDYDPRTGETQRHARRGGGASAGGAGGG